MVNVGEKKITKRTATAQAIVYFGSDIMQIMESSGWNNQKGNILQVALVAGTMGAKKTAELIPLCHPVMLTHIQLDLVPDPEQSCVRAVATAATHERTGVEMEALTAVQVALLTIYDMCKAIDRGMTISDICVERKSGGNSGDWQRSSPSN